MALARRHGMNGVNFMGPGEFQPHSREVHNAFSLKQSVEQTGTAWLKARPNPVTWDSLTFRQSCYSESPPGSPQPKTCRKMFSFFNVLMEWLAAERR